MQKEKKKEQNMSKTMLAMRAKGTGGPEIIEEVTLPRPSPSSDEVLIEVHAAGVSRPDVLQRRGHHPPPPGAPETLGLEVAGTIIAKGNRVTSWHIGDDVLALLPGGGYATHALAHQTCLIRKPKEWSFVEAAAWPENAFTVWHNVIERGQLKQNETLLVTSGTSGIGATAINIFSALGHDVYATTSREEKRELCIQNGAKEAWLYPSETFLEDVKAHVSGLDVILDMLGGPFTEKALQILNPDGRLSQIAYLTGANATIHWPTVMQKRLTLTGSTLRHRSHDVKAKIAKGLETHVMPLSNKGLRPVIDKTFPLKQAAEAHRALESNTHNGKIVLIVKG